MNETSSGTEDFSEIAARAAKRQLGGEFSRARARVSECAVTGGEEKKLVIIIKSDDVDEPKSRGV